MLAAARGFSLPEVLVAMAIGSLLLCGTVRFLPALQLAIVRQNRRQALEDELWQRIDVIGKHLQRAGYCRGDCQGEPLQLARQGSCVLTRWDGDNNGVWQQTPAAEADVTGFRLNDGVLEALRGAISCDDKGWDKMTDPAVIAVTRFRVVRRTSAGYAPQLDITLSARLVGEPQVAFTAEHSVTGYNL